MGGPSSSTTAEICTQVLEQTAMSMVLHPSKVQERFVDDVYFTFKNTHL